MEKKVAAFGELLLRLTTPHYLRFGQANSFEMCFGGAEVNVAVSLAALGIPTSFITRLPNHELADAALATLRAHRVDTSGVLRGGERLGIYFVEEGAVHRGSKVIYDRNHSAFATLKKGDIDWAKVLKDCTWFHWSGITPAVSQSAAEVCIEACETAFRLGLTVSTDLNYRAKLWKWGQSAGEVMNRLLPFCHIIIGNEDALIQILGIRGKGHSESERLTSCCETLASRYPQARKIVMSIRKYINANHNIIGAALWNGKELVKSDECEITHIVDRIGGGDALTAGLLYGLMQFAEDDRKTVNFAVAAASLKHTIRGDFNLITKAEVEQLMQGNGTGVISR
ncbi:MAG: sugar kinase [Cyclobacteriaceae bacterium]|nr:sugar kinase [Cyclobacteriaceae bacterium]MCX7636580.1 sugar kinase [Cyclobacteriaceae bacterium]MDW8330594.1 sugar kinase [Cyclobacteriaceae bacterium]